MENTCSSCFYDNKDACRTCNSSYSNWKEIPMDKEEKNCENCRFGTVCEECDSSNSSWELASEHIKERGYVNQEFILDAKRCDWCWGKVKSKEKDLFFDFNKGIKKFYFECPFCSMRMYVEAEQIPPIVKDRILIRGQR